jgi:hypothetical protein
MNYPAALQLFIPHSVVPKILDSVRTIVLNWTLRLEQEGIQGDGLSFTANEKAAAAQLPTSVTNFYGPVLNLQIQQASHSPGATQVSVAAPLDLAGVAKVLELTGERVRKLLRPATVHRTI